MHWLPTPFEIIVDLDVAKILTQQQKKNFVGISIKHYWCLQPHDQHRGILRIEKSRLKSRVCFISLKIRAQIQLGALPPWLNSLDQCQVRPSCEKYCRRLNMLTNAHTFSDTSNIVCFDSINIALPSYYHSDSSNVFSYRGRWHCQRIRADLALYLLFWQNNLASWLIQWFLST